MNYQERYQRHQARKKRQLMYSEGKAVLKLKKGATLAAMLKNRRSQRLFTNEPIDPKVLDEIIGAAKTAPSSCNRHGLKLKVVTDRRDKEFLSGILVGGVGWVQRAHAVILFWADPVAYASPNEKDFMHYCDVGFTAMPMWLTAESHQVGAAYINPNTDHIGLLRLYFGEPEYIFCGALALGHYSPETRALPAEPGDINDMLV